VTWVVGALLVGLIGLGLRIHRVGQREPRFPPGPLTAVVLGARVYEDGTPSPALEDRVATGVRLLREGRADRLVFTGGSIRGRPSEASVMAQLARALGAPEAALLLEDQSRSTFENAARTAQLIGSGEVLLVTCDFHLARASAYFRGRGFTVWPMPSRRRLTAASRLMVTAKEVVGLLRRPNLIVRL
jgi:uncharacterized SAM-binding protein YcdF (DUF218 family)